jgi:hypothetical protein
MSRFVQAIQTENGKTTNGMTTNSTTLNDCVNLFFNIGAMRGKDVDRLISEFSKAFNENPQTAMRILFWARDVRGGAGERQIFRDILSYLASRYPEAVRTNLNLIPEYGRWDDVHVLFNTSLEDDVISLIIRGLEEGNGLCAKWVPRKGEIFNKIRKTLGVDPKTLRKRVVALSNTVEQKMCSGDWEGIEYSKVPSLAMSRYGKAFGKNDQVRFGEYIQALQNGETKVNAGAVYPYDITKNLNPYNGNVPLAVEQWKALPNYMEGSNELILPVVDVSGSMSCSAGNSKTVSCMDVAISLGLYISERNEGAFKDMFITFSSNPQVQVLKGDLQSRFEQLRRADWGMSTNLEATFRLILDQAVRFNIPQDEMPTKILILSDMEFNSATSASRSYGWRNEVAHEWNPTALQMIDDMYAEKGYTRPNIVFWKIDSNGGNFPVKFDDAGTALVSGFSPSIMKSLLGGDDMNPVTIMRKTVDSERYEPITV